MNSPILTNPDNNLPHKQRLGRCYELTGNIALHNSGVELVHGTIQGCGAPRIAHAWVVLPDGSIWEPVTNQVWKKSVFYEFFSAVVRKRYDRQTFLRLAVRHEHWGPWDGPEAVGPSRSHCNGMMVPPASTAAS